MVNIFLTPRVNDLSISCRRSDFSPRLSVRTCFPHFDRGKDPRVKERNEEKCNCMCSGGI